MGERSVYRCRVCGKEIAEALPSFPFCGERCRYLDLGGWLDEKYRISRGLRPAEEIEESTPKLASPNGEDDEP